MRMQDKGHERRRDTNGKTIAGSQTGDKKSMNDFAGTNHKDGKYFSFLFIVVALSWWEAPRLVLVLVVVEA